MATHLTDLIGNIQTLIRLTAKKGLDLSTPEDALNISPSKSVVFGTGTGEMNLIWHDQRILVGGANEDLDLGVLTDSFGVSSGFDTIKLLFFQNVSGNGASIEIGNAASNPNPLWLSVPTTTQTLNDGQMIMCYDEDSGFDVSGGAADELRIANSDGSLSVTYNIVLGGISS